VADVVQAIRDDPLIVVDAVAIAVDVATIPTGEGAAFVVGRRALAEGVEAGLERAARATCCFVAGTLVETSEGLRPIEEIEVGDLVLSRDEATGETAYKSVTNLVRRHDREVWRLVVSAPDSMGHVREFVFETTDDHSWRSVDGRWVTTMDLRPELEIITARGPPVRVMSIERTGRTAPTYNLEVADWHTYFVGEARVWVHNSGCFRDARRVAEQRDRRAERRERQSLEGPDGARDQAGNPQQQSGDGFRDRDNANRGPSGVRPSGPDRRNNRERNVGIDEEHSRRPHGQQGPR
jgi:hypothetical protein